MVDLDPDGIEDLEAQRGSIAFSGQSIHTTSQNTPADG